MSRLQRILTYDESGCGSGCMTWNSFVNYTLIILCGAAAFALAYEPKRTQHRTPVSEESSRRTQLWLSVAFFWVFQIVLCVIVDCVGVSIVWNSLMGYALVEYLYEVRVPTQGAPGDVVPSPDVSSQPQEPGIRRRQRQTTLLIMCAAFCLGLIADVVYLAIADGETTLAHVLSWFLGAACKFVGYHWNTRGQHGDYIDAGDAGD